MSIFLNCMHSFISKSRLEKYKKRKQIQSTVQPLRYYGSHCWMKKKMALLITTGYLTKIEAKMKRRMLKIQVKKTQL